MAETYIAPGSPLAVRVYGAALFFAIMGVNTLSNLLSGPMPTGTNSQGRKNSSPGYPILRTEALKEKKGTSITMDNFFPLKGAPVMGDQQLKGKLMALSHSTTEMRVDQYRAGVDTGGRVSRQQTLYDLRTTGIGQLRDYWAHMTERLRMVHLFGARGDQDDDLWNIPMDTHPDFARITVNRVMAPSKNRKMYGGGGSSLSGLTKDSILSLADVSRLARILAEGRNRIAPIRMKGDKLADRSNLYILLVTPGQWEMMFAGIDNRKLLALASERGKENMLFAGGNVALIDGIAVIKIESGAFVQFNPGSGVKVCLSATSQDEVTEEVPQALATDGYVVHRALLLGASSLAEAWVSGEFGVPAEVIEEKTDFGNRWEAASNLFGGMTKIRFQHPRTGEFTDMGCIVIDSVVPEVAL